MRGQYGSCTILGQLLFLAAYLMLPGCAAASIARKVYLRQGLGVGLMRRQYGGRKSRGTCPERFEKSAGGLIRHILQVRHFFLRIAAVTTYLAFEHFCVEACSVQVFLAVYTASVRQMQKLRHPCALHMNLNCRPQSVAFAFRAS